MKKDNKVPGLDALLGVPAENSPADLGGYSKLQRLKNKDELSDEAVAQGFSDLLKRRGMPPQKAPARTAWWGYGAAAVAAVAVIAVSTLLWKRETGPRTPELITAAADGGKISANAVSFPENKLVQAKIENVDLKIRGVSGFSARSTATELILQFDSGFLHVDFHPGAERKKLTLEVRGTTFSVTGTKFFVQAGAELRLVVTEGSVRARSKDHAALVTKSETWTPAATAVRSLSPAETETYAKNFADTAKKTSEISAVAPEIIRKRVKIYLNLGQVVSGTLVGEDAETVKVSTSSGKVLSISRQEIEKIARLP